MLAIDCQYLDAIWAYKFNDSASVAWLIYPVFINTRKLTIITKAEQAWILSVSGALQD